MPRLVVRSIDNKLTFDLGVTPPQNTPDRNRSQRSDQDQLPG